MPPASDIDFVPGHQENRVTAHVASVATPACGSASRCGAPGVDVACNNKLAGNGSASGRTTAIGDYENVIFDFDSTVIKSESLEMMLENVLAADPKKDEKMSQIVAWTAKGMAGDVSFKGGLEARLRIAAPRKQDLESFGKKYCPAYFSDGMETLIADLHAKGKKVFILSGGFRDLILPFARHLHIPDERAHAVLTHWDEKGDYAGLDDSNGFATSKLEGAMRMASMFREGRTVMVGDGYTDYQVFESGLAQEFVAYTEHVARDKVTRVAPHIASDCIVLQKMLGV
ncbi:unnamed protein product [Amoebophrya sp. A25]|nr:unnamed protein product [Amoebophrya sp. A25]|eukprot:GSA25T00015130001.1